MKNTSYKIGLRTIKTGLAVGLSMYIASFFNLKSPVFVGIGAIMSMQSSVSESFKSGKDRMLGTFVGAIIGLIFSYLLPHNYFFLSLGIIITIYIHNLLGWNSSLTLSAIVYLAIFLNTEDERLSYAFNRLLDTFMGISVSVLINYFIAAPNQKKIFLEKKLEIVNSCKTLVYNLVKNKSEISLEEFNSQLKNLDKIFSAYKHDLDLNVAKSNISETSISILSMLDVIYNNVLTIFSLDMRPILNERNAELFKELYEEEFIPYARDNEELDVVYNYHLNKILMNLIEIEKLIK